MKEGKIVAGQRGAGGAGRGKPLLSLYTQPGRPTTPCCPCSPLPNLGPEGEVRAGGHPQGRPTAHSEARLLSSQALWPTAVRMGDAQGLAGGVLKPRDKG